MSESAGGVRARMAPPQLSMGAGALGRPEYGCAQDVDRAIGDGETVSIAPQAHGLGLVPSVCVVQNHDGVEPDVIEQHRDRRVTVHWTGASRRAVDEQQVDRADQSEAGDVIPLVAVIVENRVDERRAPDLNEVGNPVGREQRRRLTGVAFVVFERDDMARAVALHCERHEEGRHAAPCLDDQLALRREDQADDVGAEIGGDGPTPQRRQTDVECKACMQVWSASICRYDDSMPS